MRIEPYAGHHCEGIASLCRVLGWTSYSDVNVVKRGCSAPGVVVRVAVDPGGEVVGFAQAMGDGVMQSSCRRSLLRQATADRVSLVRWWSPRSQPQELSEWTS